MNKKLYEQRHVWVIARRATVREKPEEDSPIVTQHRFGQPLSIGSVNLKNGRMHVLWNNRKDSGWIPARAVTRHQVEKFFWLEFRNKMGKRIPYSDRYHGKVTGFIGPNEHVEMIAKVGEWCLTNRGWSKFAWFEKCRDIFDERGINLVYISVMEQVAKEYKNNVNKILKRSEYLTDDGYIMAMAKIINIAEWFLNNEYGVAGEKRLDYLNEAIGIDRKWLKEKIATYEHLQKLRRKVRTRNGAD